MKTLYFECNMGAAGDMLTAALLELHPEPDAILKQINEAGIPGVTVTAEPTVKSGVSGTKLHVSIHGTEEVADTHENPAHDHPHAPHTHSHGHLSDILTLIDGLRLPPSVKENAKKVYSLIAEAESAVHSVPVGHVHFHEVGTLDAVADVVSFCLLMDALKPEKVLASPVATGSGHVHCAHGLLPVPAPATALILQGVPIHDGGVKGELCTPTGAALLKAFVTDFGPMPVMRTSKIGYGMGQKDFERVNCVRAFWGETSADSAETVTELTCNLDDMTPEALAYAQQLLMDEGALDVCVIPAVMKKGRCAVLLYCLCKNEEADRMASLLFKSTTTLGLRVNQVKRFTLRREVNTIQTSYGPVRVKTASGFGVKRSKPEYEDVSAIARTQGISMSEVLAAIPPL